MKKTSEKWKEYLEKNSMESTFEEVVESLLSGKNGLKKYGIRLTYQDIAKIIDIAHKENCSFDEVVQNTIQMAYDVRFCYKRLKHELLRNQPEEKLDGETLKADNNHSKWSTKTVMLDDELVKKTCLIGRRRSNNSNKEMPVKIQLKESDGSTLVFQFYLGSTVRLVLNNYGLFSKESKLINASKQKNL